MELIYTLIGTPLGLIMWAIYQFINNYGLALLFLTLLVNLLMFPLSIGQQKNSSRMAVMQPEIAEIQKKYKDKPDRTREELQKLYDREKYNPMSGCLPMFIQFPILFGMIDVVYNPLKHILRLPAATIDIATDILGSFGEISARASAYGAELSIIGAVRDNPSAFLAIGSEAIARIQSLPLDFLGIDLTVTPSLSMLTGIFSGGFNTAVFIPILAGITAMGTSLVSLRNTPQMSESTGASMKGMMLTMPLFSIWFSFQVAAGVGLYWVFSNLVGLGRILIMNRIYNPKEMAEKARLEMEQRREQERLERLEARKKAKEAGLESDEGLSQKEINRRKLAAARKRDAEKYGEIYNDVTDDDLG